VLVGLLLIAARIWWSVDAAIPVFLVTLTMYPIETAFAVLGPAPCGQAPTRLVCDSFRLHS